MTSMNTKTPIDTSNFLDVAGIVSRLPAPSTPATIAPTLPPTQAPTAAPTCAPLTSGKIVRDQINGAIYTVEGNTLRSFPTYEIWQSWGMPQPDQQFNTEDLVACPRGETHGYKPTPPPTSRPPVIMPTVAPTSAAPIVVSQFPPPSSIQFPPNLVVLVHEGEWMSNGILKVLTLRNAIPSIQSFTFKDLTQIFALESSGSVRAVEGTGTYLEHGGTSCDAVSGGFVARQWRFVARDNGAYVIEVDCSSVGLGMRRIGTRHGSSIVVLTDSDDAGWFVVPVARV